MLHSGAVGHVKYLSTFKLGRLKPFRMYTAFKVEASCRGRNLGLAPSSSTKALVVPLLATANTHRVSASADGAKRQPLITASPPD